MAKFNFKFQSILSLKEKFEEKAKVEYGIEMSKLEDEKKILFSLNTAIDNSINKMKELNSEKISITELNEYNNYILGIKTRIITQRNKIERQELKVIEKQKKLALAMRERKSFEKMRVHAFEVYQKEEKIMEQKQIDELISFKHSK